MLGLNKTKMVLQKGTQAPVLLHSILETGKVIWLLLKALEFKTPTAW